MKKMSALFFAVLFLLTTVLSGCGETPSTDGSTEAAETTASSEEDYSGYTWEDVPEEDYSLIAADTETLEKAIQQVALAMYYKNPYVQYEARSLSDQAAPDYENIGVMHYQSPEIASYDQYFFMQCNSYCVNAIYEAFHYVSFDGQIRPGTDTMTTKMPEGTLVYMQRNVDESNFETVKAELKALLRPGDIIAAKGSNAHALLYLGDCFGDGVNYVAHCWGKSIDKSSGVKNYETDGAIYVQPEDQVIFGKLAAYPTWNLKTHATAYVGIIRLSNAADFTNGITKSTQSRIKYPYISVDKTLDRAQYRGVATGETVEVRISVTNNGTEAYKDLHIKDYVPRGTVLVSGDTEVTIDVQPGETKTMAYKVKVIAKAGETVTFGKGFVDEIRTREITCNVSTGFLSTEQIRKLNLYAVAATKTTNWASDMTDIITLYKEALNIDVDLPQTTKEFSNAIFETVDSFAHIKDLTADSNSYRKQIVVKQYGGRSVSYLPDIMERCLDAIPENFREGDVFVSTTLGTPKKGTGTTFYVCLGSGKFLKIEEAKATIVDYDSTLSLCFAYGLYYTIRPSIGATGFGETEGVLNAYSVKTEEDFDAAIKAGADELVIEEDLTLTKKRALGSKYFALTIRAGKTLDIKSFGFSVNSLLLEEGAHIVTSEDGRINLFTYSQEDAILQTKTYEGEAVAIYTQRYFCTNHYDCLSKTVNITKGNEKRIDDDGFDSSYENLKEAALIASEGWTIVLGESFTSNKSLFFQDGITLDLNGFAIAFRDIGNASINIIDSKGSGAFYFEGAAEGETVLYEGSINAPSINLTLGYCSGGVTRSVYLTFTGKIVCKKLIVMGNSTYTTAESGSVETKE